jgi:hypothetical protein
MVGVRKHITVLVSVFAFAVGTTVPTALKAIELGNILFPNVEQRSREASAMALEAIAGTMSALAAVERNKKELSQELFGKSAALLRKATGQMSAILDKAKVDKEFQAYLNEEAPLQKLSKEDSELFAQIVAKMKLPKPKTRQDVFLTFVQRGDLLAAHLEKPTQNGGTHRPIIDDVDEFLKMGDIVTNLMRTTPVR